MGESANFRHWEPRPQWVTQMDGVFIDATYVAGDIKASVHFTPAVREALDRAIQEHTDIPRILSLFTQDPTPAQLAEGYWLHDDPRS